MLPVLCFNQLTHSAYRDQRICRNRYFGSCPLQDQIAGAVQFKGPEYYTLLLVSI